MDNLEKLATYGSQDDENKTNMCWTPLHGYKHKQGK
jgi:hypothetical protein